MQVAARKKFFGKDTGASSAAVLPPEGRFSDLSLNRDERSDVYRVRSTLFFGRPSVGVQADTNMSNLVGRSAGWGAIFGAAAAFASGSCAAIFWSTGRTGHAGDFATLMILWVPPVVIMAAGAAAVLFGVVAAIVSVSAGRIEASPVSYAVLGSLLSLGIVILPFAAWVAGGLHRALQGAQGVYLLLPMALLPVAIAGLLTGWMVRSARN